MVLFQDCRIPSAATVLGMSLHYITLARLIRLLYYYSVVAIEISIITPILNPSVAHIGFLMKKNDTWADFSPVTSVSPCSYHSTNASYSCAIKDC